MKIIVHTGLSIEDKCGKQLHPVTEVKNAKNIIDKREDCTLYSNSPDFVSTIHYYAELKGGIEVEYWVEGVFCGNELQPVYENWNECFKIQEDICGIQPDEIL